ncbi:hypothetical protein PF004_g19515 [Phytophthora fragariae]|uniref:General transcription factor IIH subunit 4 n=1 Tax=Phytophthora fragariae TaxID=53985 RepID=A0A6G0N8J6_9STRA|nr:hypothetical protein PF004_g19515 [Phytophthora fragariae]
MPGKVFVGGKVQPLGRSIDSKQLRLATSTQASPRHDENNSFRRRSRPSSSSLSSFTLALQHVRPAPRVLVFVLGEPIKTKESDGDNFLRPEVRIFRKSSAHDESIWRRRAASTVQLAKEIADGGSLLGYFAKVCIKLGDFLADFALLYLNLEAGSPVALVLVFSAITVSSALSSAVLVSLPPEKTSLLIDTLLDTLFDFLIAIAYPWCKQLKHVSLIYTHMMELPDWFKEFTKLEYLHIEGIPENSLESLSDDLFNNMPSLTMDAFDFLETLPPATLERLYQDPWACQAIFQALPPLAQQFVMRLLPSNAGVPRSLLEQWVVPEPGDAKPMPPQFHAALHKLEGLKVFVHQDGAYRSHPTFQKQLMYALSNLGGSPWERGRLQLPKDPENTFAAADLERYARARWDSVLHYMVGSTAVQEPPQSVVDILLRTKLLQASGADSRALHITDTGYEFMLKDIHVQMWIFMLEYIRTLDNTGTLKQEDILQFLFQISYCQTGEYYAVADLTETQRLLLGDFIDFGLLFRKRPNSDRFYTTSLAVNLIFGGSTGQKRSHVSLTSSFAGVRAGLKSQVADPRHAPTADHGAQLLVVVETNFKIYAYTTSTLHVAMLSVFVDIVARLPNLAIGFITRESLRSALIHGISAQQIYDFLMKHAHPKMRRNTPVIPENIADQIYLWERERNRVQFMEGILFDGFNTKEDYESVRDYAEDLKVLTWSDPIHFRLSIATAGIDDVRHYIQSQISSR